MQLSKFIEGLNILSRHFTNPDGYHTGAEHDQFFVYATDTPLTEEEVARMRELGWWQPEVEWAEDADGGEDPPYDPEDGWSAVT